MRITGAIALEKVLMNIEGYDVVVVNLSMPIMDGLKAIKNLRDAGYRNPILVHSALELSYFKREVMDELFSGFSHKSKGVKGLINVLVDLVPYLAPHLEKGFVSRLE